MDSVDEVERALRNLEALLQHEQSPTDAEQHGRTGKIPDDLADEQNRTLLLNVDEEAAREEAVAALEADLRFEYMKDGDVRVWRFACICVLGHQQDPVATFMAENARKPEERTCYLPIEFLTIDHPVEIMGIRLLPRSHEEVPPSAVRFNLDPPVGSVVPIQVKGTNLERMKERALRIANRALRIMRVALRAHRSVPDMQLRFRVGEGYSFGDRRVGWKLRPDAEVSLNLDDELVKHVQAQPVARLAEAPRNDLQRRADRALRWIEDAALSIDLVEELLFLFFALEALLGRKDEGLKARGLAFRRAMLGVVAGRAFTDPNRVFWLYEKVRSAAVHGEEPPEIDQREVGQFAWDVRNALAEYLELAADEKLETRRAMLRFLERHPERDRLIDWLVERDPAWTEFLDAPLAGAAKVPEIFPPDDRTALFVESMTQAANDVEFTMRQAGRANPEGASLKFSVRHRFGLWVRLANGFLFEGLEALHAWEQEDDVRILLDKLTPEGRALLGEVRGLRQRVGPEALENVRQHTFHYPHPHAGKQPDSTVALSEVLRSMTWLSAEIDLRDDAQHTFLYADQVALELAMKEYHRPTDPRFKRQDSMVRDGGAAFVNLVKHIYLAFSEIRGYGFLRIEA